MADRPILFSAPMVRALLAGTKTQTRRLAGVPTIERIKEDRWHIAGKHGGNFACTSIETEIGELAADYLPIQTGDRLYVREAWRINKVWDAVAPRDLGEIGPVTYEADGGMRYHTGKFRQAMHQPKRFSRLTLHVTEVRVQRLQDISDDDAAAEGLTYLSEGPGAGHWIVDDTPVCSSGSAEAYAQLWEHINGAGAWAKNPWVAAYTFTVEKSNIDGAA